MAERIEQREGTHRADRVRLLRRRRAGLALIGGAALLAAVGACGSGSDGDGSSSERPSARPEPVGEVVDLSTPGVHELPPAPIDDRGNWGGALTVWAGDALVVWGGESSSGASDAGRLHDDGAVLSIDDGRWTPMPPSPFDEGLYQPSSAWDGEELIVIGTECQGEVPPITDGSPPACPKGPAAAAFDPASFSWRRLDPPPIPPSEFSDVPTLGRRSVAVGGNGEALFTFDRHAVSITWDRASGAWDTVPSPAPDIDRVEYCADEVRQQVVAAVAEPRGEEWETSLWVLPVGSAEWRNTATLDRQLKERISCGDGYVTAWSYDGIGTEARSIGILAEVDTGAVSSAFAATKDLRSSWIVGPWLLAHSSITTGDLASGQSSHPVAVRLVQGGDVQELEPVDAFSGTYVPGVGIVSRPAGREEPMLLWRAPDHLQP